LLTGRDNQPSFSTIEIIIVFIAADIPRILGQVVAATFGLPYWAPFGVGLVVMVASMLGYFVIRGIVLSD